MILNGFYGIRRIRRNLMDLEGYAYIRFWLVWKGPCLYASLLTGLGMNSLPLCILWDDHDFCMNSMPLCILTYFWDWSWFLHEFNAFMHKLLMGFSMDLAWTACLYAYSRDVAWILHGLHTFMHTYVLMGFSMIFAWIPCLYAYLLTHGMLHGFCMNSMSLCIFMGFSMYFAWSPCL